MHVDFVDYDEPFDYKFLQGLKRLKNSGTWYIEFSKKLYLLIRNNGMISDTITFKEKASGSSININSMDYINESIERMGH